MLYKKLQKPLVNVFKSFKNMSLGIVVSSKLIDFELIGYFKEINKSSNLEKRCNFTIECCVETIKLELVSSKLRYVRIVSPIYVNVGICVGTCQQKKGIFRSFIDNLWNKLRRLFDKKPPKIQHCCVPQEAKAFQIFKLGGDGQIVLNNIQNFLISKCRCL